MLRKRIVASLSVLFLGIFLAAVPAVASGSPPAVGSEGLSEQEQVALANKLFKSILQRRPENRKELSDIYEEVVTKCPLTKHSAEAAWRLSNIYTYSADTRYEDAERVLEFLTSKHPKSRWRTPALNRLSYLYNLTKDFSRLADLYSRLFNEKGSFVHHDLAAHAVLYADALVALGKTQEARRILYEVFSGLEDQTTYSASAIRKRLETLK